MSSDVEQETIILINQADYREGYFMFTTSRAVDFKRLIRRVCGENNLLSVREVRVGSHIEQWICKVPIKYLSRNTFGIGKKKAGNPNPNFGKKEVI